MGLVTLHIVKIQENKDWNTRAIPSPCPVSPFLVKIQENKDWNNASLMLPPTRYAKMVKIQENKDWNGGMLSPRRTAFRLLKSKKTRIERNSWTPAPRLNWMWLKSKKTGIEMHNIHLCNFPSHGCVVNPRKQGLEYRGKGLRLPLI